MAPYLDQYGYWAVFGGILLEDFGLPLPGETLLIAGSAYAARGNIDIVWVLALAWVGAVIGDNIGYLIGRFGGRRLALKWGRYVWLTEEKLAALERFFHRYGGEIVIVARFFAGLRQFNGIIAGIAYMEWKRFVLFNILGAFLWVGAWGGAAYFFGHQISTLLAGHRYASWAALAVVATALLISAYLLIRRRRANAQARD